MDLPGILEIIPIMGELASIVDEIRAVPTLGALRLVNSLCGFLGIGITWISLLS